MPTSSVPCSTSSAATSEDFLNSFLHTLDRSERTLLMLHYVEHLTVEEISHVLHLSAKEVSDRLGDIRRRTRTALSRFQPVAA
jgi:DNA-directed RNA polymerase specialized sigma24 family protein